MVKDIAIAFSFPMFTPETSKLFTRSRNPRSGIESLILTERQAPVQQTFYYTSPSATEDGRFLWLGCGYPPPGGKHSTQVLAVVDFERDEMRVYPETQFPSSRPLLDTTSGEVYWCNELDVWKRGPHAGDKAVRVNTFPKELAKGKIHRLATHPTFSADRQSINIDALFIQADGSLVCYLGEMPLDGSPFRLWQRYENRHYDHAMFSPVEPDVQLFAHEFWVDHAHEPFEPLRKYHRMWVIRRGEKARPVLNEPVSHSGHEWWDPDGKHVYYLHYGVGIKKVNLASGGEILIWPGRLSHGHSDVSGHYLVADLMADPVVCDCHVEFCDTLTGKTVEIVNRPPLAPDLTQCTHLHPHPQFLPGDRYICHTTTIEDRVDLALVPVEQLIAAVK